MIRLVLTLLLTTLVSPLGAQTLSQPSPGDTFVDNNSGITFVYIPGGCFKMGHHGQQPATLPPHEVCLNGFWLGQTEVTQAQYQRVMQHNPSWFKGDTLPVEQVNWGKAAEMARRLSDQPLTQTRVKQQPAVQHAALRYRLPSEAEWEYACTMGGRHTQFCGSGSLERLGWYKGNSATRLQPVKQKRPNGWGLYDMSGNAWEWVTDCWHPSYDGAPISGRPWTREGCQQRVFRGGSWNSTATWHAATKRYRDEASGLNDSYGFRLVREQPPQDTLATR